MCEAGYGELSNIDSVEQRPLTSILFPCIDTMFNFYNEYASLKGFGL